MKPVAALCKCIAYVDGEYQFEGEGAVLWLNAPESYCHVGKQYLVSVKPKDESNERTDYSHHVGR